MTVLREAIFWLTGVAFLVLVNLAIIGRETIIEKGDTAILALAPVDPRSLIQGDYMALAYELQRDEALAAAAEERAASGETEGLLVLAPDAEGVHRFRRIDDGRPLGAGELRLIYRWRDGRLRLAGESFFFQEGTAETYQRARFAAFKVGEDGDAVLVGLRDETLAKIEADDP